MQEARLGQTEQDKLLEVLTPVQVLRFQAMREEMGQRIRRLRGMGPGGLPAWDPGAAGSWGWTSSRNVDERAGLAYG